MRIEKKTTKRKLTPKNEFTLIEKEAVNAPVKDVKWHGEELDTSTRIEDPGTGKPIILRSFDFNLPPDVVSPTKEQLLNYHKPKLMAFLWKDGLDLIEEMRVVKTSKNNFKILAVCQVKYGSHMRFKDKSKDVSFSDLSALKPLQEMIQEERVNTPGNKI